MAFRRYFSLSLLILIAGSAFTKDQYKNLRIEIRVDQNLGSDISRSGEAFSGSLNKQVALAPNVVIPKGSVVQGIVTAAEPTMRYYQPGVLELELTSLSSGGKLYRVSTSILRLMGKERRRDPITGKQDDRGARQEDATRAVTGVVLGGNTSTARTIPGTDISAGTSDPVGGMQVIVPKNTKLTFTITSSH
jgi:hypothetical protein